MFKVPVGPYDNVLDHGGPFPRTFLLHMDEGSPAFAMTWFLCFHLNARFAAVRDAFHQEWNDIRLALGEQKLWWVVLLTTMVYNSPYGPWKSTKWCGVVTGSAVSYTAFAKWTSPLSNVLYELICEDQGIAPSGRAEQKQDSFYIFSQLSTKEYFSKKGEKVALRRRFSWCDWAKHFDLWCHPSFWRS